MPEAPLARLQGRSNSLPGGGYSTAPLGRLKGLLIDLDGVVYTGAEPIPGAGAFLAEARRRRLPFLLATNNSTTPPEQVAARLAGMGIEVHPEEILTSADVAAAYVAEHARPGVDRVLVVGEVGLRRAIEAHGLELVDGGDGAAWVVVGLDRAFDYARLTAATLAVLAGARFVASNADPLLPVEGGRVLPGAGSMVAAISRASGATPIVTGKPEAAMFERGLRRLGGLAAADVAMVGDRLDTDVEGGRRAGLRTILVLSGVATAEEAARAAPPPDAVCPDLASVAALLGWS